MGSFKRETRPVAERRGERGEIKNRERKRKGDSLAEALSRERDLESEGAVSFLLKKQYVRLLKETEVGKERERGHRGRWY
jgi:hypothetical protein